MTGTEGAIGTPQTVENLVLNPPMVIPEEIKDIELTGQIPAGEIAYFDIANPNLRLVDRKTWQPVMHGGREKGTDPKHLPKTFAAIILHTPPRTPENSYEEEIYRLSNLLKRSSKKDENKVTVQQNLGVLFIVEDLASDMRIGWRQDALAIKGARGLVVNKTHEGSVIVTDSHIISFARRQKQFPTIDMSRGQRSRHMVPPFVNNIQRHAENAGLTANTDELENNWHATKNVPETLSAMRDGNGVEYEGMDDDGHPIIVHTDISGITTVTNEEGLRQLTERQQKNQEPPKKPPKREHKTGDKVTREDLICDACGNHPQDIYIRKPGNVRWLLIKETVCNEAHRDGIPRSFGKSQYIRPLDFLPKNQQKPQKTSKK